MKHPVTFALTVITLFLATSVGAQMTVFNTSTVNEYVQDVLLGQNVSVSNITINGLPGTNSNVQLGEFEAENCNIGIGSGVIMASGGISGAVGPNNSSGTTIAGNGLSSGNDPDLLQLCFAGGGSSIHEWVIIEFDFVPLGDTLSFKYVFASEEYPEWVSSTGQSNYNDFFGFFLSGPGINGTYSDNAENIALIPGTDVSVGIGTLNNGSANAGPCSYCEFYNQDGTGWDPDEAAYTDPFFMQYDGYTDVLTALAVVQCGETYHIKLAVSDSGDGILDSAVFLERESFSSNLVVQVEIEFEVGGPNGDVLFEDCGEAFITFSRPQNGDPNTELTAYIDYSGVAVMGVDYSELPDSVVFDPGVMFVSFPLDAFEDGVTEGPETVHLDIANFAECSEVLLQSEFEFEIWDTADPLVVDGFTQTICQGASIEIEPIISGGYGNYGFDWSTGESTQIITVTPGLTTTYNVNVTDTCGMPSDDADITIEILDYPDLEVSIDSGDLELDCGESVSLTGTATGGDGIYEWYWFDENDQNLWGWQNTLWYSSWSGEGEINVEVTDGCGFTAYDVINVTLNIPDLIIDIPETVNAPCNEIFTITADVSGGLAPYYYQWQTNGMWEWDEWDNLYDGVMAENGIVTVTISDNCGQSEIIDVAITVDTIPVVIDMIDVVTGTCMTEFDLDADVTGGTSNMNFEWTENGTTIQNSLNGQLLNNFQTDVSTSIILTVSGICNAYGQDTVDVVIDNPPVVVEIGPDVYSSCITDNEFYANVTSGAGGYQYAWFVDGQPQSTGVDFEWQSFETAEIQVAVVDACGSSDTDLLTLFIPDIALNLITSADTAICVDGTAQMWALASGGEEGFVYQWLQLEEAGTEASITAPEGSAYYTIVATDICGESIESDILVEVLPLLVGFLAIEMEEDIYRFEAHPEPYCDETSCSFIWDFGDGSALNYQMNPVHEFDGLTSYTTSLIVTNEIGCTARNEFTIVAPAGIFIPNSFTPNGDGINDVFQVVGHDILLFDIHIFNRWGDEVFSSKDPNEPWLGNHRDNGTHFVPNGVYSYVVKIKGYDSDAFEKSGTVTVLR